MKCVFQKKSLMGKFHWVLEQRLLNPVATLVFNVLESKTMRNQFRRYARVTCGKRNANVLKWLLNTPAAWLVALMAILIPQSHAANITWSGASNNRWSVTGNWTGGVLPNGTNNVTFNTVTGGGSLTPSVNAALAVNSLNFLSTASAFTIGGANILTINGGGITNNSLNAETINAGVLLGANQTWYDNAGSLTLKTVNLSNYNLTASAASGTTISLNGVVSGAGGLIKNGAGTLALGGNNTFTGSLALNAGTVQLNSANALDTAHPNSVVVNGGTLNLNGNSATVASIAGNSGIIINSALLSTATLTVSQSSNTTYGGTLNNGTLLATLALVKNGAGVLTLTASNSFSGATTVNAGSICVQNNHALGTSTVTMTGTGSVQLNGTGLAVANNFVDNSDGSGNGGLENLAQNTTLTGTITVGATGGRVNCDSGTLTVDGGISGTGTLSFGGAGETVVSTAGMSGGMTLEKDGAGTLTLNTANTYTGGTTLTGGQLTLGANGALGSGAFKFAGGILNANDHTASLGALSLTANSTLNLDRDSTSATLTFSTANDLNGSILTINGWSGSANSAGTDDHIFLTANPSSGVLADIDFTGYAPGATRLSNGEIVPVPEPITWAMMIFGVAATFMRFVVPRFQRKQAR